MTRKNRVKGKKRGGKENGRWKRIGIKGGKEVRKKGEVGGRVEG